jgi:ethanolamine permease
LVIEGVALVAEEVVDPRWTIPRGYGYGMLMLVGLALGVMVITGGATDWRLLQQLDYPLPEALECWERGALIRSFLPALGCLGWWLRFMGLLWGIRDNCLRWHGVGFYQRGWRRG